MCRDINGSKRRNLLLISGFALDAFIVFPSVLHALCYGGTGGLLVRRVVGTSWVLFLRDPLCQRLRASRRVLATLLGLRGLFLWSRTRATTFILLQIDLIPAIIGDGWAAGCIAPSLTPCLSPLTISLAHAGP